MEGMKQTVCEFLENYRPDFNALCANINKSCVKNLDDGSATDCSKFLEAFLQSNGFIIRSLPTSGFSASFSKHCQHESSASTADQNGSDSIRSRIFHVSFITDPLLFRDQDQLNGGDHATLDCNNVICSLGSALSFKACLEKNEISAKVQNLILPVVLHFILRAQ